MAEATGLVLAAVPICVAVVEKYATAARLLKRYRKCSEEALYISQAINVHKSIYKNTIRILLSSVVSDDETREMLSNPVHPLWNDARVAQEVDERLGSSRDAFVDAVSAVEVKLTKLEKFGRDCRGQVLEVKNEPTLNSKTDRKGLRAKLKLAFSEREIELLITALSRLTQEVQTLIQQTEAPCERNSVSQPSMATRRKIERYNTVKGAATNLYQALSRACTVHAEHQAHLSLHAVHNDPSQIQFTLALSHSGRDSSCKPTTSESRFWLTVESVVTGTLQSTESPQVLKELRRSYKRQRDEDSFSSSDQESQPSVVSSEPTKSKRAVRFKIPGSVVSRPPLPQQCPDALPNFCTKENFCTQLHRLSKQPQSSRPICAGYLELSGCSKHLIYLKSATHVMTSSIASPMVALTDFFDPKRQVDLPYHVLSPYERIRIARHLSMAVLQFQATPWLDKPWSSKEVSILGGSDHSTVKDDVGNDDLFLNVAIHNSFVASAQSVQFPSRTLVRNRLLFSLGIMMLELAFQTPLTQLRRPQDIDQHEHLNTDYFTADRIRRQVSAHLGPRYAEAARKCIQCDFGHGSDLNETKLQEGFYQDVICELEALEQTFREFKSSI